MRTSVVKHFCFEAAHFLPDYEGKCSRIHGHSYKLDVAVSGSIDDATGMIVDFGVMKKVVSDNIINRYDHQFLNDFFVIPTAENISREIFKTLDIAFAKMGLVLESVKLWETENSYAECRR